MRLGQSLRPVCDDSAVKLCRSCLSMIPGGLLILCLSLQIPELLLLYFFRWSFRF
jgi:hypothetical protein